MTPKQAKTAAKPGATVMPFPLPGVPSGVLCLEHSHPRTGDPLPEFTTDQKRSGVVEKIVGIVVAENDTRLALGRFQPNLLFRHGEQLVTLIHDDEGAVQIFPLVPEALSQVLEAQCCYVKIKKDGIEHRSLPSVFQHRARILAWQQIPTLAGVLQHPAIHLDGTVVIREGYDPVTKCWIAADWSHLAIPTRPTAKQITAAIETLREPFDEVIFDGDTVNGADPVKQPGADMTASEANLLGLILTAFMRRELETAPFFPITSSSPGTAKGLIASLVSHIVQDAPPLLTIMKQSDDQAEKNIDRTLHDAPGAMILQFDEPEAKSSGGFFTRQLAAIATTKAYSTRPVYGQRRVDINVQRTWLFTGINVRPNRDLVRRVSVIHLGVPTDGTLPHQRTFKHDDRASKTALIRWVKARRSDFIQAVLVLTAAWRNAGCPQADFEFDFDQWVHTVGGILQHAGVTTWMDNRTEVYADADEARFCTFLRVLVDTVGKGPITSREITKQLIALPEEEANANMDLLLWDNAEARNLYNAWGGERKMNHALGEMLRKVKDVTLSDGQSHSVFVSEAGKDRTNAVRWQFAVH